MKHPSDMILHHYVDDELNSVQRSAVVEHFLNCDLCSSKASQMKKIDTYLVKEEKAMPLAHKNLLFDEAFELLDVNKRKLTKVKRGAQLRDYLSELRAPAISLGTCLAIILILTQSEKNNLINDDFISMDVEVYEGENNEGDTSNLTI